MLFLIGICSETEVSEQFYYHIDTPGVNRIKHDLCSSPSRKLVSAYIGFCKELDKFEIRWNTIYIVKRTPLHITRLSNLYFDLKKQLKYVSFWGFFEVFWV